MQTLNLLDPFSSGSAIYPEQKPEDYYEDIVPPLLWHLHPCSSAFQKKHKTDIWIAQKDALGKLLFTFLETEVFLLLVLIGRAGSLRLLADTN